MVSTRRGLDSRIVHVGNVPRTTVRAICPIGIFPGGMREAEGTSGVPVAPSSIASFRARVLPQGN